MLFFSEYWKITMVTDLSTQIHEELENIAEVSEIDGYMRALLDVELKLHDIAAFYDPDVQISAQLVIAQTRLAVADLERAALVNGAAMR